MTEKNYIDGQNYADDFYVQASNLPGADVPWLNKLRQSSIAKFVEAGMPGPKVEEWKYCNLNVLKSGEYDALLNQEAKSEPVDDLFQKVILNDIKGSKVVFIDGYINSSLTEIKNQDGVTLMNLSQYIKAHSEKAEKLLSKSNGENSLRELNLALMTDGYVLNIAEGVKLAEPIQVIHISTASSSDKALRQRNFINIESGASAQIIESHIGNDDVNYWAHNVSDIVVAASASLEIYQFQTQGSEAIHMSENLVDVAQSARFEHYSLNIGSKLNRMEVKPTLNGLHGEVELRGAFLGRDGATHDVFTHMKHMVPECNSNQVYRGVLDKGGKSAFQGKVYVAKDAQLTNADQSNKNLLLDRNAEANSKPELLIYADDVKCSHGTTVGELDQEALFYMKSRGLDQNEAKALMVEAFVAEVYEDISLVAVKEKYLSLAREWLDEK